MTWVKGFDMSFDSPPMRWWGKQSQNNKVFVQCAWTGGYASYDALRNVARGNLEAARAVGMKTAVYVNANPWYSAQESLQRAIDAIGQEQWDALKVVAVDWEIQGTTVDHVDALCSEIEASGREAPIYSALWIVGTNNDPRLKERKAWLADWDRDPSIATTALCGPWGLADLVGKQYRSTTVQRVAVDLDTFLLEYF